MSLPPRLLSGSLISLGGRVAGTAVSVLTVGVVTRGLTASAGVEAYGEYAAVFAVLGVFAVVADGGLYLTFARLSAQTDAREEVQLLRTILGIRLVSLLGAALVLIVLLQALPYSAAVRAGVLVGTVGIAGQLVSQLLLGVFQKRLRMAAPAVAEVIGRALTLFLALLAASRGGSIFAYVSAFVAGSLVTLAVNLAAAWRLLPPSTASETAVRRRVPDIMRESWPLGLMLVFWLIVFRADSVLLSLLRPSAELAWYALPYKVLESLLFFPAMLGGLLFPALSRSTAAPDLTTFRNTLRAALRLFLLLALPTVIILILVAPVVIDILGGDAFSPSVPILRVLAVALGALFFGNLFGNSAVALGLQRSLLFFAGLLAAGNVAANLVVIPRAGPIGAAWTTLGTEALSALGVAVLVRVRAAGALWGREHHRVAAAGMASVGVALLPLPLVVRVSLALAVYGAALWFLHAVRPAEIRALLKKSPQWRRDQAY